jgi:hypothetical protein
MWPQSRYRGRQRVYLQAMRSPTYLHESRVYSQKKFRSRVQKDFYNKICHERTHAPQPNIAASFVHCVAGWNLHPHESELFAARNAAFHDRGIVELRSNRFTVRVELNTDRHGHGHRQFLRRTCHHVLAGFVRAQTWRSCGCPKQGDEGDLPVRIDPLSAVDLVLHTPGPEEARIRPSGKGPEQKRDGLADALAPASEGHA